MLSPTVRVLMDHNEWTTRVLLERSRALTTAQFHERFEIGPGSIHDTLRHIIGAMLRWTDHIGGRPLRDSIERRSEAFSVDELLGLLGQADAGLRAVAEEIEDRRQWSETVTLTFDDHKTYRFSRTSCLMHVVTHGMHHRAQILNMRRRLGLPPLGLDLDVVEWEAIMTGQISEA